MAVVIPFQGTLYNTKKIQNLGDVVAPPFDIISEANQENLHNRHPQNIVWLTLGRTAETDTATDNRYTRAAEYLEKWGSENILIKDQTPAFYLTAHQFYHENKPVTRYGLIARVALEPFEKGVVLPHEKTFSNIKAERLQLIKTCKANLSPIFSLYSDDDNRILNKLMDSIDDKPAEISFTDYNNHEQRLWRIIDPDLQGYVTDAMQERPIFIADGHHRYGTALNYKYWLADNTPDFNDRHPGNYVMMYLCNMEDPGLVILPAHRLLSEVPASARSSLIQKATEYFEVVNIPFKNNHREKAQVDFLAMLKSNASQNCLGIFMKDCPEFYLLTLKPNVMEQMFGLELAEPVRNIDVTVLTRLIFMEILGFNQARLDNEKLIAYSSVAEDAIDAVNAGKHDIAFILNPTKIQQVRQIAEEGLIMPRKATYFFPKVITGLVINRL